MGSQPQVPLAGDGMVLRGSPLDCTIPYPLLAAGSAIRRGTAKSQTVLMLTIISHPQDSEAAMPTVIAIEAKPLGVGDINSEFHHLYLVKTVTDSLGRVLSEKVIRGSVEPDGSLGTLANVDLASSPDRRGSDTPQERHRTILDLGARKAEDVWAVMVKHAVNIDAAHLPYSFDVYRQFPGGDLNSNSVVSSVLHSVGINWATHYPVGIRPGEVPLYGQLQHMKVNDVLYGTARRDIIFGGVGNDAIYGGAENDRLAGESGNDRLHGGGGNDNMTGGTGDDRLYGGDGRDTLRGNSGRDAFVFNTRPNGLTNLDTLSDFSVADDTIWLDNNVFASLGQAGPLRPSMFWAGTAAHDATDRVVYDSGQGVLYYDPDGTGAASKVAVTKLSTGLKMTYADILIV